MKLDLKLGFYIYHQRISYPGFLQDHIDAVSHVDFGYFDMVNPVDQVKYGSQGSDSKTNNSYIFSRHAQDQYYDLIF